MIPDSTNVRVMADNIRKLKTEVENAVELPSVETTDEGKVLTVNSSGKWAALDPASQLPAVTSEDEGSLLTVNSSGEWAKGNPIIGNLNYSETEQNTGVKWIDGKYIYRKVLVSPPDDSATVSPVNKNLPIGETYDKIIYYYGVVVKSDSTGGLIYDLTDQYTSSNHVNTRFSGENNRFDIGLSFSAEGSYWGGAYVIVYYTKPDPEPEETEAKKTTCKKSTTKGEN